jgi:flagellar hook-associated protein 3 FlgL
MPFRVTDASTNANLRAQLATSRQRLAAAQERLVTGRRINRPSDDPAGAEAVLRLRTSRAEIAQFRRNGDAARDALLASDRSLDSYQLTLDRAGVLLSQGASTAGPGNTATAREALATEIESLSKRILGLANGRDGERYTFGGTRQSAPPFDPTTAAPAATPTTATTLQLEPGGAPVATGVTAETVFSDATGTVFQTLTAAAAALRGTGDPDADAAALAAAMDHLKALGGLASTARAQVGASLGLADEVGARLEETDLSYAETANRIEGADFAESALALTESERALEAILQSAGHMGKRTLLDILG